MDFSLKNSKISKKSGKLIKMQQFNQIFNFLFFVPNFLQKIKKFIKSKKQKFFVFVGSHTKEKPREQKTCNPWLICYSIENKNSSKEGHSVKGDIFHR